MVCISFGASVPALRYPTTEQLPCCSHPINHVVQMMELGFDNAWVQRNEEVRMSDNRVENLVPMLHCRAWPKLHELHKLLEEHEAADVP